MSHASRIIPILALAIPAASGAQIVDVQLTQPDLDRWNYPFNASPGVRTAASTFGALGLDGFDDRDAQFLIGFDTGLGDEPLIEPELGPARYDILSAQVTITVLEAGGIPYDPTFDALETYLPPEDPDAAPDSDAGRPVEIYGAAFRNDFTAATFQENTSFGPTLVEGARNAFPTDFEGGDERDVSNNVASGFEVDPFAIGQVAGLSPGAALDAETVFSFDLDVNDPDVQSFLQSAVDGGRIRLMVTSLHFASGGPGGADEVTFPMFYTKENKFADPFGLAATLDLSVEILEALPGDLNGDGAVNAEDLANLLGFWGASEPDADLDGSGTVGAADLAALLGNWTG